MPWTCQYLRSQVRQPKSKTLPVSPPPMKKPLARNPPGDAPMAAQRDSLEYPIPDLPARQANKPAIGNTIARPEGIGQAESHWASTGGGQGWAYSGRLGRWFVDSSFPRRYWRQRTWHCDSNWAHCKGRSYAAWKIAGPLKHTTHLRLPEMALHATIPPHMLTEVGRSTARKTVVRQGKEPVGAALTA